MDERETGRKGKPLVSIVRGYYFLVKCFMMYSKLVSIIFNQINETWTFYDLFVLRYFQK